MIHCHCNEPPTGSFRRQCVPKVALTAYSRSSCFATVASTSMECIVNDQLESTWGEEDEDMKTEGADNTWGLVPAMDGMRIEDLPALEDLEEAVDERHQSWVGS